MIYVYVLAYIVLNAMLSLVVFSSRLTVGKVIFGSLFMLPVLLLYMLGLFLGIVAKGVKDVIEWVA